MATKSKLELAVDAGKWEDGLKKAQASMSKFSESVGGIGNLTRENADKMARFVKIMGETGSKATSVKGQMRDYTNTIQSLQLAYKQLSETDKKGVLGQQMLSSIDKLKSKLAELKDMTADLDQELKHMASDTAFSDGMNMMAGTIGNCASAVVAWTGDGKEMEEVIKDLAKIQTTIAAVEALTKAFQKQNLVLLKNPYVLAATAIATIGMAIYECTKKTEKSAEELEKAKQAQEAYRKEVESSFSGLGQLVAKFESLTNQYKELSTTAEKTEWIEKNKKAFGELGVSINNINDAENAFVVNNMKMMKAFELRIKSAYLFKKATEAYERYMADVETGAADEDTWSGWSPDDNKGDAGKYIQNNQEAFDPSKYYTQPDQNTDGQIQPIRVTTNLDNGGFSTFKPSLNKFSYNQYMREYQSVNDELSKLQDELGLFDVNTNNNTNTQEFTVKLDVPDIDTTPIFGVTKSMKELNEQLARYNQMKVDAQDKFTKGVAERGIEHTQAEIAVQPVALELGVDTEQLVPIQESINNFFKENPIELLPNDYFKNFNFGGVSETAQDTASAWQAATRAISSAGSAMTNLEDPSAKVAGIVMQAIANVALGFAQASASPATGAAGVFGWIAAATAGVATMTATIAQIKSATEYHADGGMVGMSPFIPKGTDTVPAMLTPGEIVLNAAQQRNMADNLQGTSNIVMQSSGESRISGEDLVTVINAYGRRTGRGEILK